MIKFTPEQIKKFPVAHLSHSAIRCYMTNRQIFYKRFIRLEFDDSAGPSLVEGKAYHKALEYLYGLIKNANKSDYPVESAVQTILMSEEHFSDILKVAETEIITQVESGVVDFGKTGSPAKSLKTVEQALNWYRHEAPDYYPMFIEAKVKTDCADLDGEILPIAMKIVYDLVCNDDGEIDIVDHKLVSQYEDEETGCAAFELQAAASFFTARSQFGREPKRMIFDQLKKSRNTNGDPQRKPFIIDFRDDNGNPHPCLARFIEVYRRVVMELAGFPLVDEDGAMRFIPNPFDMMNGEEAWIDFCREVDTGTETISAETLAGLKAKSETVEALTID